MDVWVKDLKTGKTWILDTDKTKPVYNDENGTLQINYKDISKYKFYPFNPDAKEQEKEGYQFTLFDF